MRIPTKDECIAILGANNVPRNIILHLLQVCNVAEKICGLLDARGISVNKDLVVAAAMLHDIKKINSRRHEIEGADFVRSLGYPEVSEIIQKHGLSNIKDPGFVPKTWEEKIVFYADKRVNHDKIVSVDERFDYIMQRYKNEDIGQSIEFTKKIEAELLNGSELIF